MFHHRDSELWVQQARRLRMRYARRYAGYVAWPLAKPAQAKGMASAGLAKRQRQERTPTYRVVSNVGGTCFETTVQLCKAHSSYLYDLLDSTDWE